MLSPKPLTAAFEAGGVAGGDGPVFTTPQPYSLLTPYYGEGCAVGSPDLHPNPTTYKSNTMVGSVQLALEL